MPTKIDAPTSVKAAGTRPKLIEEFVGLASTRHGHISIARMRSPAGWSESGQRPEFQEVSVVLEGLLRVEFEGGAFDVTAGQAVLANPGEWVRYSTPAASGAEYIAVCLPAFAPDTVHRDA